MAEMGRVFGRFNDYPVKEYSRDERLGEVRERLRPKI